jgi:membrane fusion protein, multidrug efflux system
VDNQVDQTTGTVKLKAEFPNHDLQLWPGQFVNVKLLVDTLKDAIVVPSAAIQRGPNGTFVYIAKADDTVAVRPVEVSQQDDAQAVLAAGVATGERVVTTGFAQLNDGTRITIGTPENLERPAGSERRRKGPEPTAQAEPQPPAAAPSPAADRDTSPKENAAPSEQPPSPAVARSDDSAPANGKPGLAAGKPATTTGETPRSGSQRRSSSRSSAP